MFVSDDRKEAIVFYFRVLAEPNGPLRRLKLRGLDLNCNYRVSGFGDCYRGDRLVQIGLPLALPHKDYTSVCFRLTAES
ncbi:GH36 C-terminal domain-containing protein [Paenibacillus sp. P25]|nr:GH36 C-terminal domain-containing protein [Paenibacillus sp. P25]